jgi:hypothetical protein
VRNTIDFSRDYPGGLLIEINNDNLDFIGGKPPAQRTADAVATACNYGNGHNLSLIV